MFLFLLLILVAVIGAEPIRTEYYTCMLLDPKDGPVSNH